MSTEEHLYLALHPPSPLEAESVEVKVHAAEINSALQPCLPTTSQPLKTAQKRLNQTKGQNKAIDAALLAPIKA